MRSADHPNAPLSHISHIYREKPGYPALLKELHDPPEVLFCRGSMEWPKTALAVVGSRKSTTYGKMAVEKIIAGLAGTNITIISGLAYGIDALAHRTALDFGLPTIAVLGSPIVDRAIYPRANFSLAMEILNSGGALLSEFPEGSPTLKMNFPKRNRIIAGLSQGCLVVEAGENSGALITAEFSLEMNRESFAVPGSIFSEQSAGTNKLIQQGAWPVTSAKDIIERLGLAVNSVLAEILLSSDEKIIYECIGNSALSIDEIAIKAKLETRRISAVLSELELRKLLKQDSSGSFYKTRFS